MQIYSFNQIQLQVAFKFKSADRTWKRSSNSVEFEGSWI